jgi:putative transposase
MPRRKRLNLTDIPLHIVQRGNNRVACFYAEQEFQFYLHWLEHYAKQYGCAIHAYVLMTNHVHLLVSPFKPEAPAKLMQSLGQRCVQYVNKFYRRGGTLWEGRYKASFVQADEYLLACYRYIEMNPVRANMVAHPSDYAWSSYRANAEGKRSTLLTAHPLFNALAPEVAARQEAYQARFNTELDPDVITAIRGASHKGQVLGDERFKDEVARMTGQRVVPATRGRKRSSIAEGITAEQVGFGF